MKHWKISWVEKLPSGEIEEKTFVVSAKDIGAALFMAEVRCISSAKNNHWKIYNIGIVEEEVF